MQAAPGRPLEEEEEEEEESKDPRLAAETEDPLVVLTALCWVLDAIVFWARRRDVADDTDEKEEAEVRLDPDDTPLLIALPLEV